MRSNVKEKNSVTSPRERRLESSAESNTFVRVNAFKGSLPIKFLQPPEQQESMKNHLP
jgi:hypothetical protein